jgi:hypothetical protein
MSTDYPPYFKTPTNQQQPEDLPGQYYLKRILKLSYYCRKVGWDPIVPSKKKIKIAKPRDTDVILQIRKRCLSQEI